jgi:hypothetical protein
LLEGEGSIKYLTGKCGTMRTEEDEVSIGFHGLEDWHNRDRTRLERGGREEATEKKKKTTQKRRRKIG